MIARLTKRVKYNKGNQRGIEHPRLFADNSLCEVLFPNGQTEELTDNVIDENMLSQVYSEGHHYQVPKEISDHSGDESALNKSYGFIRSHGGNLQPKKTTRG